MSVGKFIPQIHLKEPGFVYTTFRSFKKPEKKINHIKKLNIAFSQKRINSK